MACSAHERGRTPGCAAPSAPWAGRLLLGVLSLTLLASLLRSAPAFASRPHEFKGVFGSKCIAEPCEGGSLKSPAGVAVNEETGDVYVVDEGANRVVRFSSEGAFHSEFNGSGTLLAKATDSCKAAGSGGKAGEFETGRFSEPQTIAVDNTCKLRKLSKAECKAKDPSSGDVYVVDAGEGHRVIDKYSPAGEYLGQIAEGEEGGVVQRFKRALDGVAIDPQGNVWVYQETRVLQKYSDAKPNAFSEAKTIALACCGAPGFAIDAKGDFYLRHAVSGVGPRIAKLDPSGKVITDELLKEDANSVAADQGNSNALIDNNTSVALLNPEGAEFERLGEEHGVKHLTEATGIGRQRRGIGSAIYVGEAASWPKTPWPCSAPQNPRRRRSKASPSPMSQRTKQASKRRSTRAAKPAKKPPNTASSTGAAAAAGRLRRKRL